MLHSFNAMRNALEGHQPARDITALTPRSRDALRDLTLDCENKLLQLEERVELLVRVLGTPEARSMLDQLATFRNTLVPTNDAVRILTEDLAHMNQPRPARRV